MSKKINSDFLWLFHLAMLRKVIKDDPENYADHLGDIGKDIGCRLAEDFCARFSIYEKVQNKDVAKYLKILLEFYFDNGLVASDGEIRAVDSVLKHQRSPGAYVLKEIFQAVFDILNGDVIFTVSDDKILLGFKDRNE